MLDSFKELTHSEEWKVIAVDNASSDRTLEILRSYEDKLPITILTEHKRGKNHALNLALEYAEGDLIVLTDDDILPEPDWLSTLRECASNNPQFDIFGGRILPEWIKKPSELILNHAPLGVTYAITPNNRETGPAMAQWIWGPNMAVRNRVFDSGLRFNTNVGPNGTNYAMGSETEFTERAGKEGFKSWYCDESKVRHIIREHQVDEAWVSRRAFRYGRGSWVHHKNSGTDADGFKIFGVPRWYFTELVKSIFRYMIALLINDPRKKFLSKWNILFYRGYISQGLREYFS